MSVSTKPFTNQIFWSLFVQHCVLTVTWNQKLKFRLTFRSCWCTINCSGVRFYFMSVKMTEQGENNWSEIRSMGASALEQTNQLTATWQAGLTHAQWVILGCRNMAASWSLLGDYGVTEQLQHQSGHKLKGTDRTQRSVGAEERLTITPRNDFTGKCTRCRMPLSLIHPPHVCLIEPRC